MTDMDLKNYVMNEILWNFINNISNMKSVEHVPNAVENYDRSKF